MQSNDKFMKFLSWLGKIAKFQAKKQLVLLIYMSDTVCNDREFVDAL